MNLLFLPGLFHMPGQMEVDITIIGENVLIKDSFVGPFTSIYHDVTIENSELARCIVLEHTRILNIPTRIEDSLIGRHVTLKYDLRKPRALKLNLGDHSRLWLP